MKKSINLLVITMLLLMSCETENVAKDEQLVSKELDSEVVFKTLFFYLGEEANSIPTFENEIALLNKTKEEDESFFEHYNVSAEKYLNKVKQKNPNFLNQLRDAVQNKDFEQIKEDLIYGRSLLMSVITIDLLTSIEDIKVEEKLTNLDIDNYDFTNLKELEVLNKELIAIVGEFDFSSEQNNSDSNPHLGKSDPSPHPDAWLTYQFSYNYSLQLVNSFNNFARIIIYPYNPAFIFNTTNALQNNVLCLPSVQVKRSPITNSDYENYSGEKLIKEIVIAFE